MKREQWTEADLKALPQGENDQFELKSGLLLEDENEFFNVVAKALSAFANSGGGSLIIGVRNDGCPDGVSSTRSRTPVREWFEQKIPRLLDYPLSDFRVHTVARSWDSAIPMDKEVIVIDVGDSQVAPHQSSRDKIYYRREGGHSVPAAHFYIELLRQRLTNPVLSFELGEIVPAEIREFDGGLFLQAHLRFEIKNIGRMAAYKWRLSPRSLNHEASDVRWDDWYFGTKPFPVPRAFGNNIPIDTTILADCSYFEDVNFGVQLRPAGRTESDLCSEIRRSLGGLSVSLQLATEVSPGELVSVSLGPKVNADLLVAEVKKRCPSFISPETACT